jgi:hypothetical protein
MKNIPGILYFKERSISFRSSTAPSSQENEILTIYTFLRRNIFPKYKSLFFGNMNEI